MNHEETGHLYVTYEEYHHLIEKLSLKILLSGWTFDTILCLSRGGLRPGDMMSRVFRKPLAILAASSYREGGGTIRGELAISRHIAMSSGELEGRILLVDDIADSGQTLLAVNNLLRENYKQIIELRSAVIWTKGTSAFMPDYSMEYLPASPWIHQPFECYDKISPEELFNKWKGSGSF